MNFSKQYQQIEQFLKDKEKILLLTHSHMDGDALGSILAMYLFFKKLGKEVTAICNEQVPPAFKFLPMINILHSEFSGFRDFIVSLDTKRAVVDKMKYSVEEDKVNIIITPKQGSFNEKDISFHRGDNKYDAMIILDTPVLEQLGMIYENNIDMFFAVPIINIDHHVSNVHFGHINLIDVTAASTTEILFDFFKFLQKEKQLFDKDIATLLLAGIITDTGSFKNNNTTPKSLEISADLYDLGANQQDIIKNIYKTKRLSTLKLWGKVLSKLQNDPLHRLVWSTISQQDFQETHASYDDSEGIIDELISNAPGAEVFVLIKELEDRTISVSIRTVSPNVNASDIAGIYNGGGHLQAAGCKIKEPKESFEVMTQKIISSFTEYQKRRLGLAKEIEIQPLEQIISTPKPQPAAPAPYFPRKPEAPRGQPPAEQKKGRENQFKHPGWGKKIDVMKVVREKKENTKENGSV